MTPPARRALALAALALAALALAAPAALAAQVNVNAITPAFSNPTAPAAANVIINNVGSPVSVVFGVPDGGTARGALRFASASTPVVLNPGLGSAAFAVGTLTHANESLQANTSLTAVDLGLSLSIGGVASPFAETFRLFLNNTDNVACLPGDPLDPCDDILTFGQGSNAGNSITVGGVNYFFNVRGFSKDGGATFLSSFRSPEGGTNSAILYGEISTQSNVIPEPATVVLTAAGLAGLLSAARRRRATA